MEQLPFSKARRKVRQLGVRKSQRGATRVFPTESVGDDVMCSEDMARSAKKLDVAVDV